MIQLRRAKIPLSNERGDKVSRNIRPVNAAGPRTLKGSHAGYTPGGSMSTLLWLPFCVGPHGTSLVQFRLHFLYNGFVTIIISFIGFVTVD